MRFVALVVLLMSGAAAFAEARVALVIGNAAYAYATPLANPTNDARKVAEKLGSLGFDVMLEENLNGQAFRLALGTFADKAVRSDLAIVFYAGHGIEMGGNNYLIPVDSQMATESTAQFETVALEQVLTSVRGAKKLGIVMLDACRDNPFASSMVRKNGTRAVSRGLAPVSVEGEGGLVVSFAAEAGRTADDGDTMHSPYTEALLEVLDQPGLEVGRMFRTLRAKVRERSAGRQVPIEQAQLPDGDIFITPVAGTAAPLAPLPVANPVVPNGPDPTSLFFDAVRSNDSAKLAEFIALYPDHPRAADARQLMESLEDDAMWLATQATGSESALRRYLLVFPDGTHGNEAARMLEAMRSASAPAPLPIQPVPMQQTHVNPTFDCAKAGTAVEYAICGNADLARQDHELLASFTAALANRRTTKALQRDWIAYREARCAQQASAIYQCVYDVNAARIAELR